jgi:hypothetical protein
MEGTLKGFFPQWESVPFTTAVPRFFPSCLLPHRGHAVRWEQEEEGDGDRDGVGSDRGAGGEGAPGGGGTMPLPVAVAGGAGSGRGAGGCDGGGGELGAPTEDARAVYAQLSQRFASAPALRTLDPAQRERCALALLDLLPTRDLAGVRAALQNGEMLGYAASGWGDVGGGGIYLRHLNLPEEAVDAALGTLAHRGWAGPGPHDHQLWDLLRAAKLYLRAFYGTLAKPKYVGQSVNYRSAWQAADRGDGRALIRVVQELCGMHLVCVA